MEYIEGIPENLSEEKIFDITTVNKNDLDTEWMYLGKTIYEYSLYLVYANEDVNQIKDDMELLKGDIAGPVRSDPSDFGLSKVTEGAVNEIVFADEGYQKLHEKLKKAEHVVGTLRSAVKGLEHKKDGLLWVTKLFMMNYYADKLPPDVEQGIKERQDRANIHEIYQEKMKEKRTKNE